MITSARRLQPVHREPLMIYMKTELQALQDRKQYLLDRIAHCADEVQRINTRIAVLLSIELEKDLVQAEPKL